MNAESAAKGRKDMLSDLRAVLEQLTDETNDQPIELINDRGEKKRFSQVMLIPITAPSDEYEDEMEEHHFALLQPIDDNGQEIGGKLVFDFVKDEAGEITVQMIEDPYALRNIQMIYRERGNQFRDEDEQAAEEACESIFGGMLSGDGGEEGIDSEAETLEEAREQELQDFVNPQKEKEGKKKGFFGKLFGKKEKK